MSTLTLPRGPKGGDNNEIEQQRLLWLRVNAESFFAKTAGFLSYRANAPTFSGAKKKNAYLLAHDATACDWVRRFIGELISNCEHYRTEFSRTNHTADPVRRQWNRTMWTQRHRGLADTLRAEGFPVRQIRPLIEHLLDKTQRPRHVPEGHQTILRQLPAVFNRLRRENKIGYRRKYAPPASRSLHLTLPVLQAYLDRLPVVLQEFMRASGIDLKRGRPAQLPLARELIHVDAPRGLRSGRGELLRLYHLLRKIDPRTPRARLGWLLDVTRVWPFHPFMPKSVLLGGSPQPGLVATPAGYFPVTSPADLQPCAACQTGQEGPRVCAARSRVIRQFMKDLK